MDRAMVALYGGWQYVEEYTKAPLKEALIAENLGELFEQRMREALEARETLYEINEKYPGVIQEGNVNDIIAQASRKIRKESHCDTQTRRNGYITGGIDAVYKSVKSREDEVLVYEEYSVTKRNYLLFETVKCFKGLAYFSNHLRHPLRTNGNSLFR